MEVRTDQPGVQLYTGNKQGFCLETQHYPDSINHPQFPSPIVRPSKPFTSTTQFVFSVQ
jgi:aldose 1-epimerase